MENQNRETVSQKTMSQNSSSMPASFASALGFSSVMALARRVDLKPIGRRIMAKPIQTAALVALGVGAVIIVRRMLSAQADSSKMTGEKLHH
jgi:hypothetical protein